MAIGSTPGGSGHVVPDDPDHPLVVPEDTVAIARMEEARFREVGTKLRELLGRVNDIGVAAGVTAGSPDDGKVAAFVRDPASNTRGALDEFVQALLDPALEALPETGALRVEDFGAVCDGVTDDTAAVREALRVSSETGQPLQLPAGDTLAVSGRLNIPTGVTLDGRGSTLVWKAPTGSGSWLVSLNSTTNTTVRDVTFKFTAATPASQRGVTAVSAVNLQLDNVRVESTTAGAGSDSINALGFFFDQCVGLRVAGLEVAGFDNAIRFKRCDDWTLQDFEVWRYRLGVWISDCKRARVRDGHIYGKSPNSAQDPGHNGVLLDASADAATQNIVLEDILVEDSGATGFRLGGQNPIDGVDHVRCRAVRAGSNGFKTLGGTLESGSVHRRVRYLNCSSVDVGLGGGANTYGIAVHLTNDVYIADFTATSSSSTGVSCRTGVDVAGAKRVIVRDAQVYRPEVAAISIREALGDVSDVTIAGGFFSTNNGAHAFLIDWRWRTFRRITVTGAPVCEHYGAGFLVYADKNSSSSVVGGVSVSLTVARDAISSVISGPGATDVLMDIYGVAPSDLSNAACADGSRWYGNRGDRAFGIRRNGGWTWL